MIQYTKAFSLFKRTKYIACCVISMNYQTRFYSEIINEGDTDRKKLEARIKSKYNTGYGLDKYAFSKLEYYEIHKLKKSTDMQYLRYKIESKKSELERNRFEDVYRTSNKFKASELKSNPIKVKQLIVPESWFNDLKSDLLDEIDQDLTYQDWIKSCKLDTDWLKNGLLKISSKGLKINGKDADILYGNKITAWLIFHKGHYCIATSKFYTD